jgi:hypothetical protein
MSENERRARRIVRIRNLLRKAEATSGTPEAEALTEMAGKLMMQASIDEAELAGRSPEHRDQIMTEKREAPGRWGLIHVEFINKVAVALDTIKVLRYRDGAVQQLWAIGYESDVTSALQMADSLLLQAQGALTAWEAMPEVLAAKRSLTPSAIFSRRRTFMIAFATEAAARIRKVRDEAISEAAPTSALVLTSRMNQINAHIAANHSIRLGRRPTHHTGDAWNAGAAAGRNAHTGQSELTHQQQPDPAHQPRLGRTFG